MALLTRQHTKQRSPFTQNPKQGRFLERKNNGRGKMKEGNRESIIFSIDKSLDCFANSTNSNMKQEWRRYGAARRKELIEKDEQEGGTRFELHKKCRIEQYFSIADRVSLGLWAWTIPRFLCTFLPQQQYFSNRLRFILLQ